MRCQKCYMACSEEERSCTVCGTPTLPTPQELLGKGAHSIVTEVRAPQIQVAETIEDAIFEKKPAIIEAPVGVGKSLAYAIPAILSGKRTVISTATIGLQGQLLKKDLPFLQDKLSHYDIKFAFAGAKGKSNYICGLAVEDALKDVRDPLKLSPSLVQFARDAREGKITGDKAELLEVPEDWHKISAEECIGDSCGYYDRCGFQKSKARIQSANIIVANHAFVGADIAYSSTTSMHPLLDEFEILVLDEAHKAADYFRNAFSVQAKMNIISKAAKLLLRRGLDCVDGAALSQLESDAKILFKALPNPSKDGFIILHPLDLSEEYFKNAERMLASLSQFTAPIKLLNTIYTERLERGALGSESKRRDLFTIRRALRQFDSLIDGIRRTFPGDEPSKNSVLYVKREPDNSKSIVVSPVSVGPYLAAKLYPTVPTVIATSATLTINRRFDAIKQELGLYPEEKYTLSVESPFNYDKNAVLYISTRVPPAPSVEDEEGVRLYASKITDEIRSLAALTKGRMFVLFTSKTEMEAVYEALLPYRLTLLKQDDTTTVASLIQRYRQELAASGAPILLGLKSFWEGVSIEGDDLSCVVIVKLPFPIQNDPIYQALCHEAGTDSFSRVTLPAMLRDLQQGAGRLIRTSTDMGIVAILDARLSTASYRNQILNSLPFNTRSTNFSSVASWYRNIQAQRGGSTSSGDAA